MSRSKIPTTISRIKNDAERVRVADDLFTKALVSLEAGQWDTVHGLCEEIMIISVSIEQKIACLTLVELAGSENAELVKRTLEIVYNND